MELNTFTEFARETAKVEDEFNVIEENSVRVRVRLYHNIPRKCSVFFNAKMIVNRYLVAAGQTLNANGMNQCRNAWH